MLRDRLKEMMTGYVLLEYKWILIARASAFLALVIVFILLAGGTTDRAKQVYAAPVAPAVAADLSGPEKTSKKAILRWMRERSEMPEELLSEIYDAAVETGNPDIVIAISSVESGFNPAAKSRKGAVGLMGIMPRIWTKELKARGFVREARDLYLIRGNVASGAYIFGRYLSKTNDIEKSLRDYAGGDPVYSGKVMQALGEIYLARSQKVE